MAFTFNKCCCCIELKTGCFIIGYFNLVGAILLVVEALLVLTGGAVVTSISETSEDQEKGILAMVAAGVLLLIAVLLLTFDIVLLVGLHKNKPGHVKAYVWYSAFFLVIFLIQFIVEVVGGAKDAGTIIGNIVALLLGTYFMLVIRSMYYRMKDPSRGPAIYSAA